RTPDRQAPTVRARCRNRRTGTIPSCRSRSAHPVWPGHLERDLGRHSPRLTQAEPDDQRADQTRRHGVDDGDDGQPEKENRQRTESLYKLTWCDWFRVSLRILAERNLHGGDL